MRWPFWSFRISSPAPLLPALPPDCESIEPLLPLYADRMASPDEVRLVETHLPGCTGCRDSLFWMQATHRALASRPVAVPPASLQLRIAEAIAASSAAPSLRPARSFILRPAYVAAASLTVAGVFLGYSHLNSPITPGPNTTAIKPVPPIIAGVPPSTALNVKKVLPHAALTKPRQALIARNMPGLTAKTMTVSHALTPKTVPESTHALPDRVADNAPAAPPTHASVTIHIPVKPAVHSQRALHGNLEANAIPLVEKRHPNAADTAVPKTPSAPLLARVDKEPPPVAVVVAPSTVTTQPAVQTASAATPSSSLLAEVNAHVKAMSTVAYGKTSLMKRQISRGGTDVMHTLDTEHSGYQPAVYTP